MQWSLCKRVPCFFAAVLQASPGPSPGPGTPGTAKTKWNAILQRLHTNTAQLLSRKPGALSPRGAAVVDAPPSPGPNEQQQEPSHQVMGVLAGLQQQQTHAGQLLSRC
jgi:hypothetical protein